jgi:DNA repair exonuclease SbcCD nuclease subunit
VRLVHISDLHLGFRQYHRLTQTGINQREADVANAFRNAIDRIIALEPDVVLFAGDIFHTVRPMNPAIIHAFNQLARLTRAVPHAIVVMVAGNHDRPRATETGCILRLFTVLGVHVVDAEPRRLTFPERDLAILAVPDSIGDYPALLPEAGVRHNVLVLHGEVQGMLPVAAMRVDRAAMEIPLDAIGAPRWSYVALGHYHVHRQIAPNAYYSGSVDYTSTNPWGELVEERQTGLPGKGFIEYDLDRGIHTFHALDASRRLIDLPAVQARGLTAPELDAAIRETIDRCAEGIDEKIVRLVVRDVPRHVARELDQKALREYRRRALHFHLDARRPEMMRLSANGAPGRRPTLRETVESYIGKRSLAPGVDREALIQLGTYYLQEADAAATVAAAGAPSPLGG